MDLKGRLQRQLTTIRQMSERFLSAFETPEQWTHQVHENANHPLWFAGHMGMVDDFMLSLLAADKAGVEDRYREKFGMGSRPTSDPADYPDPQEVLSFMRRQRENLLAVLAGLSDEDLSRPSPEGTPDFAPDVASVFETVVWHEALHAGQVTVARRALGFAPLADAPPDAQANR